MEQLPLVFESAASAYTQADLALLTPEDIWQRVDEALLSRLAEDPRIERKQSIHGKELGEYFSMWANTAPYGGLMVIGQHNKGGFTGCVRLSTTELNNLEEAGAFHCSDARTECKRIAVNNIEGSQDFILLIRVFYHGRKVVKTLSGDAYIRKGESIVKMMPDQVRELEAALGQGDHEQDSVELDFPSDFRSDLMRSYCENLIRRKGLSDTHTMEELLSQTRLGKATGERFLPNVACALLFARDPLRIIPGCKVRILRFDGEYEKTGKEYNAIKDVWVEGPVPVVIDETARHIRSQLREFSKLADDNKFYTELEYPEDAWYEAVVNACVHRSYVLKNMVIFVKIFDDKLVVESPGGFPPNVTPDTIYHNHSPRNPHMMTALYFLDFVKCHAEGTTRMKDAMGAHGLPSPEFRQTEIASGFNSIRVTLRNNMKFRRLWLDAEAHRILGSQAANLKETELRILNFVSEYKSINVTQCMRLITSPRRWHSVKKLLDRMVSDGLLEHHHSPTVKLDRNACYTLPPGQKRE